MRTVRLALVLLPALMIPFPASAQQSPATQPAPAGTSPHGASTQPAADAAGIERLIEQLGSEKVARREAAQGELVKIGPAAAGGLRAAAAGKDLERAVRAKAVLKMLDLMSADYNGMRPRERIISPNGVYVVLLFRDTHLYLLRMDKGAGWFGFDIAEYRYHRLVKIENADVADNGDIVVRGTARVKDEDRTVRFLLDRDGQLIDVLSPRPPQPQGRKLGPIVTRVVEYVEKGGGEIDSASDQTFLDLDTGKYCKELRSRFAQEGAGQEERKTAGVDLFFRRIQGGDKYLEPESLKLAPVADKAWDGDPGLIVDALDRAMARHVSLLGGGHSQTRTWAFQTREGGIGVLRVADPPWDDVRLTRRIDQATIIYRLLQNSAAQPTSVPGGQPAAPSASSGPAAAGQSSTQPASAPAPNGAGTRPAAQNADNAQAIRIATLILELASATYDHREAAEKQLVEIGWPAVLVLREARQSKDPEVALRAARAIETIRRPKDVPPGAFTQAAGREGTSTRDARNAKAPDDILTVAEMVAKFRTAKQDEQAEIARQLISRKDRSVLPAMSEMLNTEDRRVRCNAGWVLCGLGDDRGLAVLLSELEDTGDRPTRMIRSDGKPYVPGQITSDRYYAAHVLGQVGDSRAVPALVAVLSDRTIDYQAAIVLGQIGDPSAIPSLKDMLKATTPQNKLWAAYGLAKLGDPLGVPTLAEFLKDPVWAQRRLVVEALGEFRDARAVTALVQAVKDESPSVRVSVAKALGGVGDESSILALESLLNDDAVPTTGPRIPVRQAAVDAIQRIRNAKNPTTQPARAEPAAAQPEAGKDATVTGQVLDATAASVAIRLSTPAGTEYQSGWSLPLKLELKNVSAAPISLELLSWYANPEVTDSSGKRMVVETMSLGPWKTRTTPLQPGEALAWTERFECFLFRKPPAPGAAVTIRFRICWREPDRAKTGGTAPLIEVFSNSVAMTLKDAPLQKLSREAVPERWRPSIFFAYREDMGLAGWRLLQVDDDGKARLVRPAYGRKDSVVPWGKYEVKLSQEQLDRLAEVLRENRIWELSGLDNGGPSIDGGSISICFANDGQALVKQFPHMVIQQSDVLKPLCEEMREFMAMVVVEAGKAPDKKAGAGGPSATQPARAEPASPEAVVDSLVAAVSAIEKDYPELEGFAGNVAAFRKKLPEEKLSVRFVRHVKVYTEMRMTRPDDIGKNGIELLFLIHDEANPVWSTAAADSNLNLKALKKVVWSSLVLSPTPSAGLQQKLAAILAEHRAMLVKLDKAAQGANIPAATQPAGESARQCAERFFEFLRTGDKQAASMMTADFDPQAWRFVVWRSAGDAANDIRQEFARLGERGLAGLDARHKDFWQHAKLIWGEQDVYEVGDRAVVWLRHPGWSEGAIGERQLLLKRLSGRWQIAGICDLNNWSLDWQVDWAATSPGQMWGELLCVRKSAGELAKAPVYVDLDTGNTFSPPPGGASFAWVKANGIDVGLGAEGPRPPGGRYDPPKDTLAFDLRMNGDFWPCLTTPAVAKAWVARREAGSGGFGGSHVVQTREGTIGLLESWSTGLKFIPLTAAGLRQASQPLNAYDTACLFIQAARDPTADKPLAATLLAPGLDANSACRTVDSIWPMLVAIRTLCATDRDALAVMYAMRRNENGKDISRALAIRLNRLGDRWLVNGVEVLRDENIQAVIVEFKASRPAATQPATQPAIREALPQAGGR